MSAAKSMVWYMRLGLFSTITEIGTEPFITKPVRELLFDGYDDMLLSIASWLGPKSDIPMDKFGWFYKVNGNP